MANSPRKVKDPTEAALSAIQEALNLRDLEPQPAFQTPSQPVTARPVKAAPSSTAEVLPERRRSVRPAAPAAAERDVVFERPAPQTMEERAPARPAAANDDRQ